MPFNFMSWQDESSLLALPWLPSS